MNQIKLETYVVGVYTGRQMTDCHMATSDKAEAVREARKTGKNVYQLKDQKYYLRKIYKPKHA